MSTAETNYRIKKALSDDLALGYTYLKYYNIIRRYFNGELSYKYTNNIIKEYILYYTDPEMEDIDPYYQHNKIVCKNIKIDNLFYNHLKVVLISEYFSTKYVLDLINSVNKFIKLYSNYLYFDYKKDSDKPYLINLCRNSVIDAEDSNHYESLLLEFALGEQKYPILQFHLTKDKIYFINIYKHSEIGYTQYKSQGYIDSIEVQKYIKNLIYE